MNLRKFYGQFSSFFILKMAYGASDSRDSFSKNALDEEEISFHFHPIISSVLVTIKTENQIYFLR